MLNRSWMLFASVLCVASCAAAAPSAEALAAAKALEAIKEGAPPEVVKATWDLFCRAHFGAEKEPMVYKLFGDKLEIVAGGDWVHASETSATIAWETNLPALTHVEYGETAAYGLRTPDTERHFYVHVHALRGLRTGATYHYRLVSVDERGNRVTSEDRTFTTARPEGAVSVPGDLAGPPYVLDKSGTTYILTRDLVTPAAAIKVLGDDITLDLDGHTVTFAQGGDEVAVGIDARGNEKTRVKYLSANFTLLNGTVRQGVSPKMTANKDSFAFNCLNVKGADAEIAGISVIYDAPQSWAAVMDHPSGAMNIHHNVFEDRGTVIRNRHGAATRPLGFTKGAREGNAFRIHHNLVKRTRQNGLSGACENSHNEVYVDSWSTNSFAIQPVSIPDVAAGELAYNRVFTTGFNPYGFGWAHKELRIHHNLVHMQGINVRSRWGERWGDINMSSAMRVTNYGRGGQKRDDLLYRDNLIVLKGREGCELRGVEFFSDETIKGLVFRDNIVKVEVEDDKTVRAACVDTQGHVAKADTSLPVVYRNNELITNICHVRFGDSYGIGSNHHFINCTFTRTGDDPRYHTFIFSRGYWSRHHEFVDCTFGPGTAYSDVFWDRTANTSWYKVRWTLTVRTEPGAKVTVTDKNGAEVFSGVAAADGTVSAVLTQCAIHPVEWKPGVKSGAGMMEVKERDKHQEVPETPHTVTVESGGRRAVATVTMDRKQTVDMKP